jgi:hypothetical protein
MTLMIGMIERRYYTLIYTNQVKIMPSSQRNIGSGIPELIAKKVT